MRPHPPARADLGGLPGVAGKVYRALVIGSGGHRIVVRRMLKRIAAEARPLEAAS